MGKNFKIDGSITTTEDLVVQGNLNVKGATNTISQETLTIKDNFIGVNGEGATLDTVGMTGLITITGKEVCKLKDGNYKINSQKLLNTLNPTSYETSTPWEDFYGPYWPDESSGEIPRFNNMKLSPKLIGERVLEDQFLIVCNLDEFFMLTTNDYNGFHLGGYTREAQFAILSSAMDGTIEHYTWDNPIDTTILVFENQIISPNDIPFICSFLEKEDGSAVLETDFSISGEAYAAPIYDVSDDALKIGQGTYEKDSEGNIKSFAFGAGQSQSIATRADNIIDGHLVKWDNNSNKFVDGGNVLPLEQGEGQDSIVQNYSSPIIDDTHFGNTSTGGAAAIFGAANTNTGFGSLMAGNLNTNNGTDSCLVGLYLNNASNYSALFGSRITNNGPQSLLSGNNISNNSHSSIIGGQHVDNKGAVSFIHGYATPQDHIINDGATAVWMGGDRCYSGAKATCALVHGTRLKALYSNQKIFGKYNENKSNTLLEIGNGTSENDRKNAFEVLTDGRAKVLTPPKENNDVVRLQELKENNTLYKHVLYFITLDGGYKGYYMTAYSHKSTPMLFSNLTELNKLFANNIAFCEDDNTIKYVLNFFNYSSFEPLPGTIVHLLEVTFNNNETYQIEMYDDVCTTVTEI